MKYSHLLLLLSLSTYISQMNKNTPYSFSFILSLLSAITLCSSLNPKFEACEPTPCGNVPNIAYPFYIEGRQESYCGYPGFALSCSNNAFPILNLSETQYIVHEIFYNNQSIRVSDAALSISNTTGTACLPRTSNLTIHGTRFSVALNQKDMFLVFGCKLESLPQGFSKYRIGCYAENETESVLGMGEEEGEDLRAALKNCDGMVKTKVEDEEGRINGQVLRGGLVLNWTVADCSLCQRTGGKCGFDSATYSFSCYCPDGDRARECDPDHKRRVRNLIIKVADFGISRLSRNGATHVTTAPQGTMGYVDPEYQESYHLTYTSDVYSFGVVLIELISSLPAIDDTRMIDEIKLANLATKRIQRREFNELVDPSLCFESDNEIKRMIVSVAELAFQCLQRDKDLRPSMYEVLEELQKIESGKEEPEHLEVHGAGISHRYMHTFPPPSFGDWDEFGSLKNMKPQRIHQTH